MLIFVKGVVDVYGKKYILQILTFFSSIIYTSTMASISALKEYLLVSRFFPFLVLNFANRKSDGDDRDSNPLVHNLRHKMKRKKRHFPRQHGFG